jgi:hypothetical protein
MSTPHRTGSDPAASRRAAPWLTLGGVAAGVGLLSATKALPALVPSCPLHALTGLDCPGCGLTRGLQQLVRGHPGAALDHNLVLALVVPLLAWAWLAWAGAPVRAPRRLSARATAVVLGALALFAVVRNLPLPGARWLASGR